MKDKIIAASVYAIAFVVVTGLIAMLNGMYRNIFKFDFSPPVGTEILQSGAKLETYSKIKGQIEAVVKNEYDDSLKFMKEKMSAEFEAKSQDSTLMDSIKILKANLLRLEKQRELNMINSTRDKTQDQDTVSEKYKIWLKNTTSLYESMEADQVAKIILNYSDNVARDIIYSMKKKKAVQILSALQPETVKRLIRVEQ